jgi:hypothetical protein
MKWGGGGGGKLTICNASSDFISHSNQTSLSAYSKSCTTVLFKKIRYLTHF